jgi:hypothetical protein
MEFPVELKCTHKKPDGTLYYGVPRALYHGRIITWYNATDRSAFYALIRGTISKIDGADHSKLPLTWTMVDQRTMKNVLDVYAAGGYEDEATIAAIKAVGATVQAELEKVLNMQDASGEEIEEALTKIWNKLPETPSVPEPPSP